MNKAEVAVKKEEKKAAFVYILLICRGKVTDCSGWPNMQSVVSLKKFLMRAIIGTRNMLEWHFIKTNGFAESKQMIANEPEELNLNSIRRHCWYTRRLLPAGRRGALDTYAGRWFMGSVAKGAGIGSSAKNFFVPTKA